MQVLSIVEFHDRDHWNILKTLRAGVGIGGGGQGFSSVVGHSLPSLCKVLTSSTHSPDLGKESYHKTKTRLQKGKNSRQEKAT